MAFLSQTVAFTAICVNMEDSLK